MTVPASRLSGKLRSESTVAHRRKIKPNQSNGVSGLRLTMETLGIRHLGGGVPSHILSD